MNLKNFRKTIKQINKMKKILISFFALLTITVFTCTSCKSKYYEASPGLVNVITKGAGFRIEGGGLIDSVYFIGTHEVAGAMTRVTINTVESGARMLWSNDLSVVIPAMQNQAVTVDAGIMVMPKPTRIPQISARMPRWDTKVYTSLETVTKKVVQSETKAFDASSQESAMLNRQVLSKKILEGTIREFHENNPGFENDFYFLAVVIGDVVYPNYITEGYAKVAQADYKLELEKIKKSSEVLKEELEAQDLESDLQAYAREGGVMSKDLLKFKSMDVLIDLLKDPNATVVFKINPDGSIDWFSK
jgi:hypothetical protein